MSTPLDQARPDAAPPATPTAPRTTRRTNVGRLARRLLALGALAPVLLAGPLATTSSARSTTLSPEDFGAVGNGVADDTAALNKAIRALDPGDTLEIGDGKVFRHTDVLIIRTPRITIKGGGTLLATDEARSSVFIDADDVEIDDTTFAMASTTQRWGTFDQMKLRLGERSGIVVRDVKIAGSAAAGIYLWGTSNFLLENVTVNDTRADGIHITGTSHDGVVRRANVNRSGDDGVGIVSYRQDQTPVKRILVDRPKIRSNSWGRGVSVVGGEDITFKHVYVRSSSAAAIYIASEGEPWNTFAPKRVKVYGADLRYSNTAAQVDHGAFLVYSGSRSNPPEDIYADKVAIRGTRKAASSQVGIRADPGCSVDDVRLRKFTVTGGGNVFSANVSRSTYLRTSWSIDD